MDETAEVICEKQGPTRVITLNRPAALNALNQELLIRLHESGIAAPSYTTLGEVYCLRVAIANFRTTSEDLVELVRAVLEIGRALATESPTSG